MEVRSTANGPGHVQVELRFKVEGELKNFSHVDLLLRKGDDLVVRAPLHEDRSKPGHVAVAFTANHTNWTISSSKWRCRFATAVPAGLSTSFG